jgi:hypothetical protein
MVVRQRTAQGPRGADRDEAEFLDKTNKLARSQARADGTNTSGLTKANAGLAKAAQAAQRVAAIVNDPKQRAHAEALKEHLDQDTRAQLAQLAPERQMVVLLGLYQQMCVVRDAASGEHKKLVDRAAEASEQEQQDRQKLAMFMARPDKDIVPDLAPSVNKAIARQKMLQTQYHKSMGRDWTTFWISLVLTALIFAFVVWAGIWLSQSNNMYRLMKGFYGVWDSVLPGSRKGTLFSEPADNIGGTDEYAYYR